MGEAGELSKKGYQRKKCEGEAGSMGTLLLCVCVHVCDSHSSSSHPPSPFLAPGHEAQVPALGFSEGHSPGSQDVGRGVSQNKS